MVWRPLESMRSALAPCIVLKSLLTVEAHGASAALACHLALNKSRPRVFIGLIMPRRGTLARPSRLLPPRLNP
ncbi:hypothetical protein PENSPDRAFT_20927 [Peniophora sp. CONT]|nr:hypothetical protein PENSPDRAFT_20927 [Peniophora sp. CONT]